MNLNLESNRRVQMTSFFDKLLVYFVWTLDNISFLSGHNRDLYLASLNEPSATSFTWNRLRAVVQTLAPGKSA